mmetsp:Transcript_21754/g.33023  ORF Transcript_21754/g.33023 Transcript_21754/m.33023 type:complete len:390 (+) Transcript_21754:128-1297(+)|eukprot:CAMPEP_0194217750 /NCGR_PEP_ID=MMETSP0156-20130528/22190_1 /TAXON_ID=33649 /ORGANISM="Thalassionema nitzschioides, Strain L26-B" /LENGTH=389 /DNA_ID=CAMNT_0038946875 /DNA_START=113 /DNA_END=1282 /DNA_ORIENTATION=+
MASREHKNHYKAGHVLEARTVTKNVPFLLGSLFMVIFVGMAGLTNQFIQNELSGRNSISVEDSNDRENKPSIYQFDIMSQKLTTGDLKPHTRKIPVIWNQIWESAGWVPKTLAVNKYKVEPKYKEIINMLEGLSIAQKRHVFKYIAMAENGGGWLAHSDTFPLHPFGSYSSLPNAGKLTVYDEHYPCLMSGNATEWLRMGRRIAEHGKVYHLREEWTEELALKQMKGEYLLQGNDVFEKDVDLEKSSIDGQWSWHSQDCERTKEKRAVHFRLGEMEDYASMYQPGDMVIKWLSMWLRVCERSSYFVDMENSEDIEQPAVVKVGTYHAPEDYNETRANNNIEYVDLSTMNKSTTNSSSPSDQEPIVTGTFHVDENYTGIENKSLNRRLRF